MQSGPGDKCLSLEQSVIQENKSKCGDLTSFRENQTFQHDTIGICSNVLMTNTTDPLEPIEFHAVI